MEVMQFLVERGLNVPKEFVAEVNVESKEWNGLLKLVYIIPFGS